MFQWAILSHQEVSILESKTPVLMEGAAGISPWCQNCAHLALFTQAFKVFQ
jgi:hypothetical protein